VWHILVLEGYPPLRRVLAVTLQRAGCQVKLARSAGEVRQALDQYAWDALLVDMDNVSGESWNVLRGLYTVPHSIPIVALRSPGNDKRTGLETLGVHIILLKPVGRDALLRGITLALKATGKTP
jgi:DNA-binding response OmpR family regulator